MFKLALLTLLFLIPFYGNTQHYIGLEAGYLASNLIEKPKIFSSQMHSGFSGGINYNYQGEKRFAIRSGLKIQKFGHDVQTVLINEDSVVLAEGKVKNKLIGLNVPFRFGYRFGSKLFITPTAGISLNYIISANSTLPKSFTGLGSLGKSTTFLEQINQLSINAAVSVEFATKIKNAELFASLDYQHALNNLFKDEFSVTNNTQRYFIAGISLGCRIPLFQKIEETAPYVKPEDLD